jgi:biotin synthase
MEIASFMLKDVESCQHAATQRSVSTPWHALADRVLNGHVVTADEALRILQSSDDAILDVLGAAYRIRTRYFGNRVQLYFLMNAKSGLCPEDCGYCSQSKVSTADIPHYNLVNRQQLLDGARAAKELHSKTYCIVISARQPNQRELNAIATVVPEIKARYGLKICVCLGLLTPEQAGQLKACGVDRVNHNLNTSQRFYENICTTHTYHDRINTLRAVANAGIEVCSGGIVGMGEEPIDVVNMAIALREVNAVSIPINFLTPIAGTPLENARYLTARDALRVLAMFRFVHPDREIRIAGGREWKLGSLQPLGLYAANSIFVGDYLTTKGQPPEADYTMIEEMGFEITLSR